MTGLIDRFNRWYDRLAGTPRFLLFMAVMGVTLFLLEAAPELGVPGAFRTGLAMLTVLTVVALRRAWGRARLYWVLLVVAGLTLAGLALL